MLRTLNIYFFNHFFFSPTWLTGMDKMCLLWIFIESMFDGKTIQLFGIALDFACSLHQYQCVCVCIKNVMSSFFFFLTPAEKWQAVYTILEAFGNCSTSMNGNASRFSHIVSLDFDQAGQVASASIQVRIRISFSMTDYERRYFMHIFSSCRRCCWRSREWRDAQTPNPRSMFSITWWQELIVL